MNRSRDWLPNTRGPQRLPQGINCLSEVWRFDGRSESNLLGTGMSYFVDREERDFMLWRI
jgi:hypothetical protein